MLKRRRLSTRDIRLERRKATRSRCHSLLGDIVVKNTGLQEVRQLLMWISAQFRFHGSFLAVVLFVLVIKLILADVVRTGHGSDMLG